ncbi:large subunit ribosomal protein L29 [Halanaerobium sp. ST460_2HS_T2]|uniref:Large ribosomal subunit protein uL29 n=2 Tax=Halanaerobiaceae TaxID=972 RepID=A0A1N6VZ83_9FIRM|nr:large subunit ribosomal protein L29 [Halanaerobium sp. ST460_2HS_T2]SIQ83078.1 large subunit ribosomal protein L29 [Halanaerobium kushneri]
MVRPMRADELRNLTEAELEQKAREFKEELFNLRFQHATAQLDNPMRIKEVKRIIARIKTILREKELGIERA